MTTAKKINKTVAHELYRRGNLSWKLDSNQIELYELYYRGAHKLFTWLLARRSGKSFALVILAIEQCIKVPNSIVKYAAPTKLQINTILRPIFKKILEDCPDDVKPQFKTSDYTYYFPNGSEIQLAGTDGGHAEKLRGGDSHLAIVDEAGSCDDLKDLVISILLPTTLTTNGKLILSGTPPKKQDHDFIFYIESAKMRGSLVLKTIFDNPRLTEKQRDDLIEEMGGLDTDEAKRELLCIIVRDSKSCVIPEFTTELKAMIVKEWKRPPFFENYVSMDIGGVDFTGLLFAYYDFRYGKIIVEDEIIMDFQLPGNNLDVLTTQIKEKEEKLWTHPFTGETQYPKTRVSDTNPIALNEIRKYSKGQISFMPTRKDDRDTALSNFRTLLRTQKIIINPKCTNFIRHLEDAKWNKSRTDFTRSPDNGHYDLLDSGVYLVRNINFNRNPYPSHYDLNLRDTYNNNDTYYSDGQATYVNEKKPEETKSLYKRLFNIKDKK